VRGGGEREKGNNVTIFFFRENLFSDQQIATVMKLILSTHSFYLTNYWNTAEETYKYFFERVLQCTVMVIILIEHFNYIY